MVTAQGDVLPRNDRSARLDRMGILLDLAKVVSGDFSINIREINIQSHDGIFEGAISLYVRDADSLHAVMDKLRKIKGIETVKTNIELTRI